MAINQKLLTDSFHEEHINVYGVRGKLYNIHKIAKQNITESQAL